MSSVVYSGFTQQGWVSKGPYLEGVPRHQNFFSFDNAAVKTVDQVWRLCRIRQNLMRSIICVLVSLQLTDDSSGPPNF